MGRIAVRVVIAACATLGLAMQPAVPSRAADTEVTVTGVVRLDGKPTAGIVVCDLYDETDCVVSGPGGRYTVTLVLSDYVSAAVRIHERCLEVKGTDTYEGISKDTRFQLSCLLPVAAGPGAKVTKKISVHSYPVARGQVINSAGRPIVGASIVSGEDRPPSFTNAQGRFSVRMGPYPYDMHYLKISAKGYQSRSRTVSPDGNLGPIVLAKAGAVESVSLSGRVVDAKGRAYVGVRVCLVEGPCVGKVHSDGYFHGLLRYRDAKKASGKFLLRVPGMAVPVRRTWDFVGEYDGFDVQRVFRLATSRRIVVQTPKISGKATVGSRLKVKTGAWLPAPVALKCAWYVGAKKVQTGCGSLQVKKFYRGKAITVKVTGSRAGYASKKATSRAVRVYR
ncbi:MAG: carboxypeptidase-like regulatory domain-containing protein [Propionicimonas sp.]